MIFKNDIVVNSKQSFRMYKNGYVIFALQSWHISKHITHACVSAEGNLAAPVLLIVNDCSSHILLSLISSVEPTCAI